MKKWPQMIICLALAGFGGCMGPQQAAGGVAPAPKPEVAEKERLAPALELEVRGVNGIMEAHFKNNTRKEVGVMLGNVRMKLKPDQAGKLPVAKVEKLQVFDFVDGVGARIRFETMLSPMAGRRRFLAPN